MLGLEYIIHMLSTHDPGPQYRTRRWATGPPASSSSVRTHLHTQCTGPNPKLLTHPTQHPTIPLPPPKNGTAGEMLAQAEPFLHRNVHPTVIVAAYAKALQAALRVCEAIAKPVDVQDK